MIHPPAPPAAPLPAAPLAPLTNIERPVNNSTGEKIPNGCAACTIDCKIPELFVSAAAYALPPDDNNCVNAEWNCAPCALSA